MEYVSAQGRQPRTETLHAERRAAGAWLAKRMGLEDSAPVYFLQRRRWVDERPVLIELIALDAGWCPGLLDHDLDTSLMSLLRERFGLQPTRCQLAMHPTALNAAQAEPLQLAPGSPALYLERLELRGGAEGGRVRPGVLAPGRPGDRARRGLSGRLSQAIAARMLSGTGVERFSAWRTQTSLQWPSP